MPVSAYLQTKPDLPVMSALSKLVRSSLNRRGAYGVMFVQLSYR